MKETACTRAVNKEDIDEDSLDEEDIEKDSLDGKIYSPNARVETNNIFKCQKVNTDRCKKSEVPKTKPRTKLGEKVFDESSNFEKLERFFSAFDFFQESMNNQRGKTTKSRKKESGQKIPLLSLTISRNERKKCSYLEQYKKKCSRKLKTVMKNTEMKDGPKGDANTSPTSDHCSISSKPSESELSVRSEASDSSKEELEVSNSKKFGNTKNLAEEKFYYDLIRKFESKPIIVNCVQTKVNHKQFNIEKGNLIYNQKNKTVENNLPSVSSKASSNAVKGKSIVEKSKAILEKEEPNKRLADSMSNVELIYLKEENNMKFSASDHLLTRELLPPQKNTLKNQNSAFFKQSENRTLAQPPKLFENSPIIKVATISNHNLKPDRENCTSTSGKAQLQTYSSFNQNRRTNAHQTSAHRVAKIARKYITERKGRSSNREKEPKGVELQNQNVEADDNVEQVEEMGQAILDEVTKKKPEDSDSSGVYLTKNTQSETALPALPILDQTVKRPERPNTTSNYNRLTGIPSWRGKSGRKNYVEIYQAKRNIRSIPIPRPVPMAKPVHVANTTKMTKTDEIKPIPTKIEGNVKTPNAKSKFTKAEGTQSEAKTVKRYYLKKKATDAALAISGTKESEEDVMLLKLLEEKKEMLQKQLQCMKSKTRSGNIG